MPELEALSVQAVYTPSPVVLTEDVTVGDAFETLVGKGISGVPVTDSAGDLLGVVSNVDLLLALEPFLGTATAVDPAALSKLRQAPLSEYVQGPPITCGEATPLQEACSLMIRERVHRLVVVAADEVLGVLSAIDVVRAVGHELDA